MTKITQEKVKNVLKEVGFYEVRNSLPELAARGKLMAENAGGSEEPRFEALPSYLPANSESLSCNCLLTIDIGGTSTKAAVRLCYHGKQTWKLLFELKNLDLQEVKFEENAFDAFCKILSNHVERSLISAGIPRDEIAGCGIVWSNAMNNKPWQGHGISGEITQLEKYKKGEWFNQGLVDGRDIGQDFFHALSARKLRIGKMIIANDTPLTMKASKHADAGMVASTGLNATILKSAAELKIGSSTEKMICNSEMGGRFKIDANLLTPYDRISETQLADTLEYISTGNFLPLLFTSYIKSYAELGLTELAPVEQHLQELGPKTWEEFRSRDLSLLLSDIPGFLMRRTNRRLYSENILELLIPLTEELILRSAEVCAVIAALSVSNLEKSDQARVISLDSRLAREIPIFWETMQSEVRTKNYFDQLIKLNLVQPVELSSGKISVPMIGLANGLDSLVI